MAGRPWGKTGQRLPPLTHKAFVLLTSFPRRVLFALHNISPGEKAGAAAVIAPLSAERLTLGGTVSCGSYSGRGGPRRMSWLLLPYFSLRASAPLDPLSREGQDLASRPPFDNGGGSALLCTPSTSWQRGPYIPGRPTPSLPGASHAFVHFLCVTAGVSL